MRSLADEPIEDASDKNAETWVSVAHGSIRKTLDAVEAGSQIAERAELLQVFTARRGSSLLFLSTAEGLDECRRLRP